MATIDIVILLFIGIGMVLGYIKGALRQLASIVGLIVGLLAAKMLYTTLAEKFYDTLTTSMTFAQILAFVIIWIVVPILFMLAARLLTKAVEVIYLGWLNRLLGAAIGALKCLLLGSLLINLFEFADADNKIIERTVKEESLLYYPIESFVGYFFPLAKETAEQIINVGD